MRADLSCPAPTKGATIMADIETMIRDAESAPTCCLISAKGTRHLAALPGVSLGERRGQLHGAPVDGSRPGIYQMPLRQIHDEVRIADARLPRDVRHHFHSAYSVENKQLPKFRQVRALGGISAIGEGWRFMPNGWWRGRVGRRRAGRTARAAGR